MLPLFVSLNVSGVKSNFLIDSGVNVNILSFSASKMCNARLQSCVTRVYAYNSSDPLPVVGKFSA